MILTHHDKRSRRSVAVIGMPCGFFEQVFGQFFSTASETMGLFASRSRYRGSSSRFVWMLPMAASSVLFQVRIVLLQLPNNPRTCAAPCPFCEHPQGLTGAPSDAANSAVRSLP